ncbi:PIR Superfamily Protein [Plasmodium ovale curtisi]|uniref:PIR Superfamily Protein n=1 Tax=Plasmodium ovale curtisi TaxID=864141 RepID=A0A1A8XG68_PLAOA|nr:PIR Superfamily Protein [Plasmodium ovale curtisi]
MATVISVNDFPSTQFKSIWNDGICYDEVNSIINHKKSSSEDSKWIINFQNCFKNNLEKHKDKLINNTPDKRCRDFYYIIYDILYQLKNLINYNDHTYNTIKETIKRYIDSACISLRFPNCLSSINKEVDYEHSDIQDKKYIDDLCEDIKYIHSNIIHINSSSHCKEIKDHILGRNSSAQAKLISGKYSDILNHYKFSSFDELNGIIKEIRCNSDENTEQSALTRDSQETSQLSDEPVPMVVIFSLLGILPVCFFLYKFTPVGTWLKTQIGKKIKLDNNLDAETDNEILDETSEYARNNLYYDKYNILYNTSGNAQ